MDGDAGPACRFGSAVTAAVVAALYPHLPAHAQPARAGGMLDEVVVTATKRTVNLQDVAQSIAVLTTADIERQGFSEMADYVKALPSVTLFQTQPARNTVIFRGISTGTEQYRTDSQAAVYLDEQPITTSSQQVSPYMADIERVESLPGPQGTLFGSAAQTGTLRIITNKPNHNGFSGQVNLNSFATDGGAGSYHADGHLNIPVVDGKLAVRAVGFYAHDGGWIDNVAGTDMVQMQTNAALVKNNINVWEVKGGRVAALWTINEDWDVLASLIDQSDRTRGSWESDPFLGDHKITLFHDQSRSDRWQQSALTLTGQLGFAELKATTAYLDRRMAYDWDNMAYEQYKTSYWGYYWGFGLYNTQYTLSTIFNDQRQRRFSQEVRLTSSGDSRFQWIAGLFYEDVYDQWDFGNRNPDLMSTTAWATANSYAAYYNGLGYDVQYPLPPTTVGYDNYFRRTVKQTAVFGEISYKPTDAWTVTVGGRWFEYERDQFDRYNFPGGLPPAGGYDTGGVYTAAGKDGDTLFKFSTQYQFDKDRMGYFLFSQGYRPGGFNSQRAANTGLVPLSYQSDQLNNYEIGIKSRWFDRRLTLNASAFLMKWKDIQLENGGVNQIWWLNGNTNGRTAETKGIEVTGSAALTQNLIFDFSAIVASREFTADTVYADGTVVPSGTTMPYAPRTKLSAALEYQVSGWKPFGGDLWMRFDYSYQSAIYNTVFNAVAGGSQGRIPAWNVGTAQLGLNLPNRLELSLEVENLWNERAIYTLDDGGNYIPAWFGDPRFNDLRVVTRPRSVGITIRKKF